MAVTNTLWMWSQDAAGTYTTRKLVSVDVTNKSAPVLIATNSLSDADAAAPYDFSIGDTAFTPKSMRITDNYIIYPFWSTLIVRNNNTTNPSLVTQFNFTGSAPSYWRFPIWYNTNTVIFTDADGEDSSTNNGVATINISTVSSPTFIGQRTRPSGAGTGGGIKVTMQQTVSAVGTAQAFGGTSTIYCPGNAGFTVPNQATANLSDITLNPPGSFSQETVGLNNEYLVFAIKDKYLYAAAATTGRIYAYDISTSTPTATGNYVSHSTGINQNTLAMFIHNNNLVVSTVGLGPSRPDIQLWSLTDPTFTGNPISTGKITLLDPDNPANTMGGNKYGICFSGDYLFYVGQFLATNNVVLFVYDISNPASPIFVNSPGTKLLTGTGWQPWQMACDHPTGLEGNNYIIGYSEPLPPVPPPSRFIGMRQLSGIRQMGFN